jgi:hypothetical protein
VTIKWGVLLVSRSTFIVDGPLALRSQRLAAARERAIGQDILTLPLLAARLAGGFVAPLGTDILFPAIQAALAAGEFKDIASVADTRAVYRLSSKATHVAGERQTVVQLRRYVVAILHEIMEP